MKCILTIGHLDILLPSISGVESIIKNLSAGVIVYDRLYKKQVQIRGQVEVGMVIVPSETKFVDEAESEVFPEETAKEKRIAARIMRGGPLPRLRLQAPNS